jgi:rRNA maturation endonuclease Nob1
MMACKGICLRHKAQKPVAHIGRYVIGQKRCQACETYIQWNNFWCPCCGYRLRTKPRNSRNKTTFRVQYAKQNPSVY